MKSTLALSPADQPVAFEVLHDEERGASLLADVVERADVRVIELRDRRGLRARSARGIADRRSAPADS